MEDKFDQAQLAAFKKLRNSKAYAVIFAVSLGRGKIYLNPPQLKNSQEDVQRFIDGFKKTPNSITNATADVIYRTQLEKVEYSLKQRGLLTEDLVEDEQASKKVRIVNAVKPFDGLEGEIVEELNGLITVSLDFPTSSGSRKVVQDFTSDQIERI